MNQADFPILEFDPNPRAIVEPEGPGLSEPASDRAVLCFFLELLERLRAEGRLVEIGYLGSEMGRNPVYRLEHAGQRLLVVHPGVGSALAPASPRN